MGIWLLQSFGEFDTQVCEEIAKEHKVDIKVVLKHYKEFIENIKNEKED